MKVYSRIYPPDWIYVLGLIADPVRPVWLHYEWITTSRGAPWITSTHNQAPTIAQSRTSRMNGERRAYIRLGQEVRDVNVGTDSSMAMHSPPLLLVPTLASAVAGYRAIGTKHISSSRGSLSGPTLLRLRLNDGVVMESAS